MDFRNTLANYVRAGYPALYVVTKEESRALQELECVVREFGRTTDLKFYGTWSVTRGWVVGERSADAQDPLSAVEQIARLPEGGLYVLLDFHFFIEDPQVIRRLKDVIPLCKATGRHLIFLSCRLVLPPELEKEITVVEFRLPNREALGMILHYVAESGKVEVPEDLRERLLDAVSGMTAQEAENAFALALVRHGAFSVEAVQTLHGEKAQILRKGGILEYYPAEHSLDDVGGLDLLKAWLFRRRRAFSEEAVQFGLPAPRGMLLLGVPGCGKSLVARATARTWGLPLLRLDMGKVFGSLVGQSEENLRRALGVAEAMAPCVLWVDEIEKGAAGVHASGVLDSGVTARVIGTFLTWLQEKTTSVFVAATANSIHALPPELMRKGRLDEIFFVDLPDQTEREEILAIHLRRRSRDPADFDLQQVALVTEGFSGAELEQVIVDGLYVAFDEGRDLSTEDLLRAASETVPLSRTRGEEIARLREWARNHARPASSRTAARIEGRRMRL